MNRIAVAKELASIAGLIHEASKIQAVFHTPEELKEKGAAYFAMKKRDIIQVLAREHVTVATTMTRGVSLEIGFTNKDDALLGYNELLDAGFTVQVKDPMHVYVAMI